MAQDNYTLLKEAYDNLVTEYHQHTANRVLGKERTTYTLNGRSFDWLGYRKQVMQELKDMVVLLAGAKIQYVETRVK